MSNPKKIRKAIFPAAGLGTRFLPATKSQPKEMLTIVDKPVIQYLAEEAAAAGIEEIILITGRGKTAIENHFDHSFELEHHLNARNKHDLLAKVRQVENIAKFIYVRQPHPLGDGHAILCAKEIIGDEPFAVMFGDDIVDHEIPALQQLINIHNQTQSSVVALEKIPQSKTSSYGVIDMSHSDNRTHKISNLVEKPAPADAPSNLGIIGKYIVTPEIIPALEKAATSKNTNQNEEIRLIDGFHELLKTQDIYGYEIEGTRYDTGDKFGLLQATIDFALKHPEISQKIKSHLKTIDLN